MANEPLLQQITQNPLLISATAENLFQSSIQHVLAHPHAEEMLNTPTASIDTDEDFWATDKNDWRAALRPYNVKNGVLQIPVMGVLLSRFPYQLGRWATGYQYIERAMRRGLADDNVKGIAFVTDSPGGEVTECFELGDKIYEARGEKPMRTFAANHVYSAAYLLGSSPGEIIVTRSGGVGSIGVVTAHYDYSAAVEKHGLKVTFIFAGDHKVDGNPYEKLPDSVKARIQKRIDKLYVEFTTAVARNRGLEVDAVVATQALTYDAAEAMEIGLADRQGSLEEEMAIFCDEVAEPKDEQMANQNEAPKTVDQAVHDTAVASAATAGATAERTRISAILASDEGKARPKAALSCAMKTGLNLEEAKAFLADLPEEKAETPPTPTKATTEEETGKPKAGGKTPFETAMDKSGNPNVGDGGKGGDEDEDEDDNAKASASILSSYAGVRGVKPKKAA